jgi:hypothetical protein
MISKGDICGGQPGEWLVIGWFTEDAIYRPLAEEFSANLAEHGAPFHLFAKPALGTWSTARKPAVVLDAMGIYPGKTLVLMDVDCIIRGDIEPVTTRLGDVGITVVAANDVSRWGNGVPRWGRRVKIDCCSRVVVFRPTEGARAFALEWQRQIDRGLKDDEHAMVWAYLMCPHVHFTYIDQRYSGREITVSADDTVICHDSAHDKQPRNDMPLVKRALRAIEKPFRTGRTKSIKMQSEMSALLG